MRTLLLTLLLATGCMVGDATPPGGGGGSGGGGGGEGGGGDNTNNGTSVVDGGMGSGTTSAACTNAVYDPCTDASQCTSGKCQVFAQQGIQVCTQTCTPGDNTTCPMQNGVAAQCNNMGICKPASANTCTR